MSKLSQATASTSNKSFSNQTIINIIKKGLYFALPPVITFLILAIIFQKNDFYPFGEQSVAWCDLKQQGIPLLMNMKDALEGEGSILYSINNAAGMNFFGVFLFFLSNPFSFLSVFVEKGEIYRFVNLLIILKLCLSALTASVFFLKVNKKLNKGIGVVLSVSYALCAYGLMYYQNIMWLDLMYLYPLLALGMYKVITEKKYALYTAILALCVIFNFYLSFMVIIAVILTIGVALIGIKAPLKEKYHIGFVFFKGSAFAALISAISWIPAYLQYSKSGRGKDIIETLANSGFETSTNTIVPLIMSSMIIAVGIFALLKPNRRRIICAVMLLLFTIPIFIEPINKMWHTGSYMSFPGRYAFISVFTGMALVAMTLESDSTPWIFTKIIAFVNGDYSVQPLKKEKKSKELVIERYTDKDDEISDKIVSIIISVAFAIAGVFVIHHLFTSISLEFFKNNREALSNFTKTLWGNKAQYELTQKVAYTFGWVYLIATAIYLISKKINKHIFALFLLGVVVCESVFAVHIYVVTVSDKNTFNNYEDFLDLEDKIEDDSFYRVNTLKKYWDSNLLGALGYNSIGHYTSLTNGEYMNAYKGLGYSSSWMELSTYGGTELSDAILSVKYRVERGKKNNSVYTNGQYSIVNTFGSLGLGVIYNGENDVLSIDECSRIEYQERIFKSLFNSNSDLFETYSPTSVNNCKIDTTKSPIVITNSGEINYKIEVTGKRTLYFEAIGEYSNALNQVINKGFTIFVNGKEHTNLYPNGMFSGFVNLGTFENTTVEVKIKTNKSRMELLSFNVASLKLDVLENALANAKSGGLDVDGSRVYGTVEAKQGEHLFVSIPYDEGFSITVNGKTVKGEKVYGDFISIPLAEGKNNIEMKYTPPGFVVGIIICIIGILAMVCDFALPNILKKRKATKKVSNNVGSLKNDDTSNGNTKNSNTAKNDINIQTLKSKRDIKEKISIVCSVAMIATTAIVFFAVYIFPLIINHFYK